MNEYTVREVTPEEQQQFLADFNAFLDEKGFAFEPIPTFQRKDIQSPWEIRVSVILQKKEKVAGQESEPQAESVEPVQEAQAEPAA